MTIFVDLIGNFDLKSMFCSSRDLIKSLENPTIYCTLSGIHVYTPAKNVFLKSRREEVHIISTFF